MIKFIKFSFLWLFVIMLSTGSAFAKYPERKVIIYVPYVAGGAAEKLTSLIASYLSKRLSQEFEVRTNTLKISAIEYINEFKSLPNDGYHFIVGNLGTHASSLSVSQEELLYHPVDDFDPVALLGETPMYIALRTDFPIQTFSSFRKFLTTNKNSKITIAHAGFGSTSYLASLYFKSIMMKETNNQSNVAFVSYGGSDPALRDLSNGYVDMIIDQATSITPYIQRRLVKPILITSDNRSMQTPKVITAKEAGIGEFNLKGWNMLFAPKGVRKEYLNLLSREINIILQDKFIQAEMLVTNTITRSKNNNTPDTLKIFLAKEISNWRTKIETMSINTNNKKY